MDYKVILQTYFELLFYGVFGVSTLFLIAVYVASYRWKQAISFLSYLGVASIPFCFGAASRYFYEESLCGRGPSCSNIQILAFIVYFFVNGSLALHFWAKRRREERALRVPPSEIGRQAQAPDGQKKKTA